MSDADQSTARAVLEHCLEAIVEDADAIRIDEDDDGDLITFRVQVASSDMGRVIGRRGRVAQSLRTVVRAAAAHEGADATVDIVD